MTTMNWLKEYTRRIALTILIYIGGISPILAITRIYGVVTDSLTREAMPYVSVYLQNTTVGCQTDKTGNFAFVTPETQGTLVVSFVGYAEQHIPIGPNTKYPLRIQLAPTVYELNEVEVKPERERYRRKGNPAVELIQDIVKQRERYRLDSHDY